MSNELREGVSLRSVEGISNDGEGLYLQTGDRGNCTEIVVVMQPGQMALTPWAKATFRAGTVMLVNLANVQNVTLA